MKKMILTAALLALAGISYAENSKVFIPVTDLIAGDFITEISSAAISDDSKPWYLKDLSATAVVIADVIGTTASAVAFNMPIPQNYRSAGELYAIVKPAASDTTGKLRADVQNQGQVAYSPTTVTAVVQGTSSAVLTAAALDNLTYLKLPNTTWANAKGGDWVNVYVGRSAGTGENFYLHGFVFEYKSHYFQNR